MVQPKKVAAKAFSVPRQQIYNLRPRMTRLRSGMRNARQSDSNSANIRGRTTCYSGGSTASRKRHILSTRTNRNNHSACSKVNNPLGGTSSNNDGIKCAICLDTERSRTMKYIPCGHGFHKKCCEKWLSRSSACPVCRTPVVTSSPNVPLDHEIPGFQRIHHRRSRRHMFFRQRFQEILNSASIIIIDVYRFRHPPPPL